ncbi:MAG: hypothetical protein QOD42_1798 [Sphingomonadales bacterium]|nr:hypothetical protein [Sphingomonadales bacterium]
MIAFAYWDSICFARQAMDCLRGQGPAPRGTLMEQADILDSMAEATLTPAEWERIRTIVRAHLDGCLQELDRLGLWNAGAHLASAIDAIDHEPGRTPCAPGPNRKAGTSDPCGALKLSRPVSETRQ